MFYGFFYLMFPFSALLLVQLLRFRQFVLNIEFHELQKADFEPSSHFVKILLVVCPNCLNQLDAM
jgi:hypothetical protein